MRAMLVEAAAKQWGVPASEVTARNHTLTHAKSGRTLDYGAVAEAAGKLAVPTEVKLKDPKDFRYIGTGKIGLIDNRDYHHGQGGLRRRHQARRDALRGHRPSAGLRRHGEVLRRFEAKKV